MQYYAMFIIIESSFNCGQRLYLHKKSNNSVQTYQCLEPESNSVYKPDTLLRRLMKAHSQIATITPLILSKQNAD